MSLIFTESHTAHYYYAIYLESFKRSKLKQINSNNNNCRNVDNQLFFPVCDLIN